MILSQKDLNDLEINDLEIMDNKTVRAILIKFRDTYKPAHRALDCPISAITKTYITGGNCNFCAFLFPDWARIFYIPKEKNRRSSGKTGLLYCPCYVYGGEVVRDSVRRRFQFFGDYDT